MTRTVARRVFATHLEEPVARFLARLGVSPNALTLAGLVVSGASAYLISTGLLWAGGIVLLASGIFDLFDGAVARATGRDSRFGALLDSFADRVSEAAVLLGLLVLYMHRSSDEGLILVYLALVGSLLVSYLRARAEGLGIECRTGIMTRPERVVAIGIGLILGHWWPVAVLAVLASVAGLAFLTSAQRLLHSWAEMRNP